MNPVGGHSNRPPRRITITKAYDDNISADKIFTKARGHREQIKALKKRHEAGRKLSSLCCTIIDGARTRDHEPPFDKENCLLDRDGMHFQNSHHMFGGGMLFWTCIFCGKEEGER